MAQTQSKLVLTYWERSPPLAVLAAAKIAGVQLDAKTDPKFTKDSSILLSLTGTRFSCHVIAVQRPCYAFAHASASAPVQCREELEESSTILRYIARTATR